MIKKEEIKYIFSISGILILLLVLALIFMPRAEAAYVSNLLKGRYIYDIEGEAGYDFPLIYEVEYEQRIDAAGVPGKLYFNPVFSYDLENENEDIDLTEGYLDLYLAGFDLRLGKQRVTWGKSDGPVLTNIVNPRDYTVNPVIEYPDQFQAVTALKANFYPGSGDLEIIWIPEFKEAVIAENMVADSIPPGWTVDESGRDIETKLENSEFLLRFSSLGRNYDYELVAGYVWDGLPAMHKNPGAGKVLPEYHRLTVVGGSISTMKGPFVFRGEAAYTAGKYYNSDNFARHGEGVVAKDEVKWLGGVDYNYEGYLFSTQFLQEIITDYEAAIASDEYSHQMTFLIQKDFLRNKLTTELNFHYDLNEEILLAKPVLSYDYSDNINFKIGGNFSLTGEIERKDLLYIQSGYLF